MLKLIGKGVNQSDLNKIVESLEKAIPNTFEYHYITYWNGGAGNKHVDHLKKAQKLGPNRVELLDELLTYYELKRDKQKLVEVSKKWYASNDISPGLFAWNYNMLVSTEQDAILITSGDNDTYPALVLQYARGIRSDVAVLNNSLLSIESYRNIYFRELGIPLMEKGFNDYPNWNRYQNALMNHIKMHSTRPLYFSISAQPSIYESFKDEVFNVGMAFKWSDQKFDNIAVTKKNYEKKYMTDYLKLECYNDLSQGVVDQMNANYLISLLTLYNHYQESEDDKVDEIELLVNRIAKKNNLEDKVAEVLHKRTTRTISKVVEDPRVLEKGMIKISDTLYAGQTEVTNEMYELFLTDLLKQKRFDELDIARSNEVNWRAYLPVDKKDLTDEELFPYGFPDDSDFPIVNITHDAAKLYCSWLTTVYNGMDHKKKKLKNVVFRLPTEREWEYLAQGGKIDFIYPWGGSYMRNSRGCYLANIKTGTSVEKDMDSTNCESVNLSDSDGAYFLVGTKSYFPNAYGLYNMSGNVSEIVSTSGVVKGGSWNTSPEKAKIKSREMIVLAIP